jgi:hypothetical protein
MGTGSLLFNGLKNCGCIFSVKFVGNVFTFHNYSSGFERETLRDACRYPREVSLILSDISENQNGSGNSGKLSQYETLGTSVQRVWKCFLRADGETDGQTAILVDAL